VRRVPVGEELAYAAAKRYVAASTREESFVVVRRLHDQGLSASIDLFGEQVRDATTAREAVDGYVALATALADLPAGTALSIYLSHVGLDIATDLCRDHVMRIDTAMPPQARLQFGAEDSARTDRTLAVIFALARDGAPVTATLQVNLRRKAAAILDLTFRAIAVDRFKPPQPAELGDLSWLALVLTTGAVDPLDMGCRRRVAADEHCVSRAVAFYGAPPCSMPWRRLIPSRSSRTSGSFSPESVRPSSLLAPIGLTRQPSTAMTTCQCPMSVCWARLAPSSRWSLSMARLAPLDLRQCHG